MVNKTDITIKTVEDVRDVVDAIRVQASDDEGAHSLEDELREAVLRAIADGSCSDPRAWAAAALETSGIAFERWCA